MKPRLAPKTSNNSIDDIAGAGGGMLLVKLAQNLPEDHLSKSWLIILAPALALLIKYIWNQFSPVITLYVKEIKNYISRRRLLKRIEVLLDDPHISEARKAWLRGERERVRLSMVVVLLKHLDKNAED